MRNFTFGYARVSTDAQNLDRQLDALEKYGVDKIYNEKMTGTKRNRPELMKMLDCFQTLVFMKQYQVKEILEQLHLQMYKAL